eukprot:TRINITY_DN158_c0_g2_i1.p1 TRINITY_DN158_c0_g2~~TRINITY_DN158_c0_g2_i1.p1  ORF type:complete len:222 (+),score=69.11 TRINITY_DN158_c0_g2_i1:36-668(+)
MKAFLLFVCALSAASAEFDEEPFVERPTRCRVWISEPLCVESGCEWAEGICHDPPVVDRQELCQFTEDEEACRASPDCVWWHGECTDPLPATTFDSACPYTEEEACNGNAECAWVISACLSRGSSEEMGRCASTRSADSCFAQDGCVWHAHECIEVDVDVSTDGMPTGPCAAIMSEQECREQLHSGCIWLSGSFCAGYRLPPAEGGGLPQ